MYFHSPQKSSHWMFSLAMSVSDTLMLARYRVSSSWQRTVNPAEEVVTP